MTAFFVASIAVKDAEKYKEYSAKAAESFAPHGGSLVLRGKVAEVLAGKGGHQMTGIVRFPDMASLNAWYRSDAYQALIPLREAAADISLVAYEVPA